MSEVSKPHSDRLDAIRFAWVQTYNEATDNEPLIKAAREDMKYLLEQLATAETERDDFEASQARLLEQLETYKVWLKCASDERDGLKEQLEAEGFTLELLRNGCEQALLLLDRDRFEDDPEAKVVRAVLRSALGSNPASMDTDGAPLAKLSASANPYPASEPKEGA